MTRDEIWLEAVAKSKTETMPEHYAGYKAGYFDAALSRDAEIATLRARVAAVSAQLTEAKSAIRWMHGYDEPGTEAFPICPEGKRYAWRGVSWQQFSIVREACAEQIPAPETKA